MGRKIIHRTIKVGNRTYNWQGLDEFDDLAGSYPFYKPLWCNTCGVDITGQGLIVQIKHQGHDIREIEDTDYKQINLLRQNNEQEETND